MLMVLSAHHPLPSSGQAPVCNTVVCIHVATHRRWAVGRSLSIGSIHPAYTGVWFDLALAASMPGPSLSSIVDSFADLVSVPHMRVVTRGHQAVTNETTQSFPLREEVLFKQAGVNGIAVLATTSCALEFREE
jgi:hypothetical protein